AHPGPYGAPDTLVAVTMGRDRDFEVSGRRDQEVHLLLAVGGVAGVVRGRGESAGGAELDPVGAGPDLLPDPGADLVGAVGGGQLQWPARVLILVGDHSAEVAVAAARGDHVRRHHHPRA